ncbi:DUF255 domain-containing protein [Hydrogenispora ethanolica]|uniref:DUF255 domain-containing protein n=1 Tax=Hydrogenispora ethanolica TaxID=1082276 RepID=UPI001FB1AC52|nr:DUF255 domain-containing protein [Hydrogenispora ethanolica]
MKFLRRRNNLSSSNTPTTSSTETPGGDEAFQKAIEEDKPILLSCGYSACHWCPPSFYLSPPGRNEQ